MFSYVQGIRTCVGENTRGKVWQMFVQFFAVIPNQCGLRHGKGALKTWLLYQLHLHMTIRDVSLRYSLGSRSSVHQSVVVDQIVIKFFD